jgi:hypothetical protein
VDSAEAEAAFRARLTDVEREGYRKPEPLTLAAFAERFVAEHLQAAISRPRR